MLFVSHTSCGAFICAKALDDGVELFVWPFRNFLRNVENLERRNVHGQFATVSASFATRKDITKFSSPFGYFSVSPFVELADEGNRKNAIAIGPQRTLGRALGLGDERVYGPALLGREIELHEWL